MKSFVFCLQNMSLCVYCKRIVVAFGFDISKAVELSVECSNTLEVYSLPKSSSFFAEMHKMFDRWSSILTIWMVLTPTFEIQFLDKNPILNNMAQRTVVRRFSFKVILEYCLLSGFLLRITYYAVIFIIILMYFAKVSHFDNEA